MSFSSSSEDSFNKEDSFSTSITETLSEDEESEASLNGSIEKKKEENGNGILMPVGDKKEEESETTQFIQCPILAPYAIDFDETSLRNVLESNLRPDYKFILRLEQNQPNRERQIIITEQILIEECLMLLTGLKPNSIFKLLNGRLIFEPKFRLNTLNKELKECLKNILNYSEIVMRIENFIDNSTNPKLAYTQVYEAFVQCLIEFMRLYKEHLNYVGCILVKKEKKFTLLDFLNKIPDPFFPLLDIINQLLIIAENDSNKQCSIKSINLVCGIHKFLVDAFKCSTEAQLISKFTMWLFVRTLAPFLSFLDAFLSQGVCLDTKHELGFQRNPQVKIDNSDYWSTGHEFIADPRHFSLEDLILPKFMHFILCNAFKICRHIEIIKMLECYNYESDIYENLVKNILDVCPFLNNSNRNIEINKVKNNETSNLLGINFQNLLHPQQKTNKTDNFLLQIDQILKEYLYNKDTFKSSNSSCCVLDLNIEAKLETILNDSLNKHVNWCSNVLIEKLFYKYHMLKFFEFLHSFYLFKSSETMFIFSKNLFELINIYEIYQDDAVLNNLLYQANSSVFTTTTLLQKCPFKSDLVSVHYGASDLVPSEACIQPPSQHQDATAPTGSSQQLKDPVESNNRLIKSLSLRVKITWPMSIIVKPENLDAYNKVFLFIMQLKQAKYDLDSLDLKGLDLKRLEDQRKKNLNTNNHSLNSLETTAFHNVNVASLKKMFSLRFRLMNFMNNAHDLICNNMYESIDEFLEKLKQMQEIDEIIKLHEFYLNRTQRNCLLHNKPFQQSLLKIFNLTLNFCDMWRKGIFYFTDTNTECVQTLEKIILAIFEFIYMILITIISKNQSAYLQPLIAALV